MVYRKLQRASAQNLRGRPLLCVSDKKRKNDIDEQ